MSLSKSAPVDEVSGLLRMTVALHSALESALQKHSNSNSICIPFHSSDRPWIGETPTDAQQAAIDWRNQLAKRNRALRIYFRWREQRHKLALFPLAGFGEASNFGSHLTAEHCLQAFEQEIELLRRELREWQDEPGRVREDFRKRKPAGVDREQGSSIGHKLRQARAARDEKQETVAERLGCSVSEVSRIERGIHQPRFSLQTKIQQYLDESH